MAALSPAAEILRAHDRDRFQTTLFAQPPARDALIALYAFDFELARIRHVVSQPMAGLIRLQWWRDALEQIAGGRPPEHPATRALHASWPYLVAHRPALEAAIDAREVEVEPVPFPGMPALDRHLSATAGGIGRIAALVLAADRAVDATDRVFRAWAIVRLLAELEADRRQDRTMLPGALLRQHDIDPDRWSQQTQEHRLAAPVRHMVELAGQHLETARRELPKPGPALPGLLLAIPASEALRRLEAGGFDHRSAWRRGSPLTPLKLLWSHARGRY